MDSKGLKPTPTHEENVLVISQILSQSQIFRIAHDTEKFELLLRSDVVWKVERGSGLSTIAQWTKDMAFKWDESNGVSNGPTALHLCTEPGDLGVSYLQGPPAFLGAREGLNQKLTVTSPMRPDVRQRYERPVGSGPHGKANALHSL